ncbi:MAG: DUF721 domain-containing protein [Vicinamibacteria bacterium]
MSFGRAGSASLASQLFGRNPTASLALLRASWPHAVGKEIARRTEILAVRGRTLLVRVPDPGWQKVLHRMEPEILARLRSLAAELAPMRLGFSQGPVAEKDEVRPPVRHASPRFDGEMPEALPEAVESAAILIDDADLRARFRSAAALYLETRKNHA